jgi:aromatic-L-amino-acid/L-tryptophan decarboxylase
VTPRVFGRSLPEQGAGGAAVDDLAVIADHSRPGNARSLAYVLGSGEPVAAIGDLYASVLNQNVTAWRSAPAAVTVERTALRWLAEAIGCEGFTGSLAGGGSSANLMGLAMAREAKAPANEDGARPCAVYMPPPRSTCLCRRRWRLVTGRANLRLIPWTRRFACALTRWRRRSSGTAVRDPGHRGCRDGRHDEHRRGRSAARDREDSAQDCGLWLHVDGVDGGLAAMAAAELLAGLAQADSSLSWKKWWPQQQPQPDRAQHGGPAGPVYVNSSYCRTR